MGLRDRFRSLGEALTPGPRVSGFPTSSNRASSFHLRWRVPADIGPLREVAATLEIVTPPSVPHLYFWALQADFVDRGRRAGGAHLGLQWHRGHPESRAANWGGYDATGHELTGSMSSLPSATGNVNTRDYGWEPGGAYRLRIRPGEESASGGTAWAGEIADLRDGRVTVVRELYASGGELTGPIVWSEVFARCDDPSVVVRWSDLEAVDVGGHVVRPDAVVTSYQSRSDGGCDNTRSELDDGAVLQITNTDRGAGGEVIGPLGLV